MDLPPLVLGLEDPTTGRTLVAVRDRRGSPRAGLEAWPSPPPEGALFVSWPTRLRRPDRVAAFAREVETRSGTSFPLSVVLERLGIPPPRGLSGLLAALAPDLESAEDPEHLGVRLIEGLAARLSEPDPSRASREPMHPGAEVGYALTLLPEAPGVYCFRAADRTALYVGKARSLRSRVPSHFGPRPAEPAKTRELVRDAAELSWVETGTELEALILEHLRIREDRPRLNRQERVHRRPRGTLRTARKVLVLPSRAEGRVEVCVVSGNGGFHWQRAARKPVLPRTLWPWVAGVQAGSAPAGWAPDRPGTPLDRKVATELSEITLTWLVKHRDHVTQIDLMHEVGGRSLARRLRALLAVDPAGERIEVGGR